MQQIPVVDLSCGARRRTCIQNRAAAREIDATCREIGFFTITGHGVPVATMDELRSKAHAFFALPLEEKRRAIHAVPGTPRGYRRARTRGAGACECRRDATRPQGVLSFSAGERWPNEQYYTGPEGRNYFIPNLWPRKAGGLCEWRPQTYYAEMEKLAAFSDATDFTCAQCRRAFFSMTNLIGISPRCV